MAKEKSKKKQLKKSRTVVVSKRGPVSFQLQFLFTDIDHKRQKIRELTSEIRAELEQAPGFRRLMEDKEKLLERAKSLKEEVKRAIPEAFKDLAELKAELELEEQKFRARALPILMRGEKLVLDGADGRQVVELDVRVRKQETEELEAERAKEEKALALPPGKS